MRTWVRRVRLWLGVLLLAVGVVGCTVGMFVSAYARWSWEAVLIDQEAIELKGRGQYIHPGEQSLTVGSMPGSFWLTAIRYGVNVDTDPPATSAQLVRSFSWVPSWRTRNEPGVIAVYSRAEFNGWGDWRVAGFQWSLGSSDAMVAKGETPLRPWKDIGICIPYYFPLLLGLALCFSPLRAVVVKRRRGRRGECLACGYDRRSLAADQPCPECGAGRM